MQTIFARADKPNNGYKYDQQKALELGNTIYYPVKRIQVDRYNTAIELVDFDHAYNSVNFTLFTLVDGIITEISIAEARKVNPDVVEDLFIRGYRNV